MKELNFKLVDTEGKTHVVHICDQSFAEAYFSDCRSIDAPTALISITCPDDPGARILGAENLHVLRLRMYDRKRQNHRVVRKLREDSKCTLGAFQVVVGKR